jgi:hypothetical protein
MHCMPMCTERCDVYAFYLLYEDWYRCYCTVVEMVTGKLPYPNVASTAATAVYVYVAVYIDIYVYMYMY